MDTAVSQPSTPILSTSPAVPEISELVPDSLADALTKSKKRRPTGKIFGLPRDQRELINQMLDEGKTYKAIQDEMAKLGVELNGENLSNWFAGPYQDYVRNYEWREDLLTLAQSASVIDDLPFGQRFQESLIQLAFVDIFRALKDPATRTDRPNHIRLLNSLARLNREALCVRKYNDVRADKSATQLKIVPGTPTEEQIRNGLLLGFEKAWGIKPADAPIGPDLNVLLGLDPPKRSEGGVPSPGAEGQGEGEPPGLPSRLPREKVLSLSGPSCSLPSQPAVLTPDASGLAAPKSDESAAALINTPIHRGESARSDEATVLTVSDSGSTPLLQNSTNPPLHSSAGNCYNCSTQLPPLKPDGTRPSNVCPGCQIRLYPPDTTFDRCPICEAHQPIRPSGERYSDSCEYCRQKLPPPGQRYVTECPGCGLHLHNFTENGCRISELCRDCRTQLPLLEPISNPSQSKIKNLSFIGSAKEDQNSKIEQPPALAA